MATRCCNMMTGSSTDSRLQNLVHQSVAGFPRSTVIGVQARVDDIRDVGIFPTYERQVIGERQNAECAWNPMAPCTRRTARRWRPITRTVLGLREDEFDFDVKDKMLNTDGSCNINSDPLGCNTGNKRASIFSPKLGIALGPWASTTYFINVADGYHSNDARGVTRSGESPDAAAGHPAHPGDECRNRLGQ